MPAPLLSASPLVVLDLFDPEEQVAFFQDVGATRDDVVERFTASDLLIWIVQHRSTFVRMAVDISSLLTKIEASIRGNIEFVVSVQDGKEVDLAFGPQVRSLLRSAVTWIDHAAPVLNARLNSATRSVIQFCDDARTTNVVRDSDIGAQMRGMSSHHPNPLDRMRLERTADMLQGYEEEVHPSDVEALSTLKAAAEGVERRVAVLLKGQVGAEHVLKGLGRMRRGTEEALRRIAGYRSDEYPPPRQRLDERRANSIVRGLHEIESLARQSKRLDEAGSEVLEAMGLSLWKERWRIYELWVLCFVCLRLIGRSDMVDSLGRIRDGRWSLKFTRDAKPVLACGFNDKWVDVYYQYFEQGEDQANMPDIALRERASGKWIAIVDPKMGETYRQRDMAAVCLRYAKAFRAGASVIASYFPDAARLQRLHDEPGAIICHGLRPGTTRGMSAALSAACLVAGIPLASRMVVVLADVSESMADFRGDIASAIRRTVVGNLDIDQSMSVVASFNDRSLEQVSVEAFLAAPNLPQAHGSTDCDGAIRRAIDLLSSAPDNKEIWLLSDGQGLGIDADELIRKGVRLYAHITPGDLSSKITELCRATGGEAFELAPAS